MRNNIIQSLGWRLLLLVPVAIVLAIGCKVALGSAASPFGWIALAAFLFFLALCVVLTPPFLRNAALMPAFVALAIAPVEFFLGWQQYPAAKTVYEPSGTMHQRSDYLGYRPAGVPVRATRYYESELIFDVVYGIEKSSLRTTPASNPSASDCLLFFGGSFTFGEGLSDEQTLTNQVARRLGRDVRVYNFGFVGYGPHQMLSALKQGLVVDVARGCKRVHAIYSGITQHIGRVAGNAIWDIHGPKYILDSDRRAHFTGHFDDGYAGLSRRAMQEALKSHIFSLLFSPRLYGPYRQEEIELYAAIVAAVPEALREQFGPESKFSVLLWHPDFFDEDSAPLEKATALLAADGIQTHMIGADVLGLGPMNAYRIHTHEQHPNALANEKVATWVVSSLLDTR